MTISYGFGEDQVKQTTNPFPVASNVDNVEITNCKYSSGTNPAGKPWECIDISYTRAGSTINDRMFAVNPDNVAPRPFIPNDTVEDALNDKIKTFNGQLLHIATKLGITREELQEKCRKSPFSALAEDYCKLINSRSTGVKLYMKTTKDGGYTKVCRNPNNTVPFLQRMDEGECQLTYTDKELTQLGEENTPKNGVTGSKTPSPNWAATSENV